MSDISKIYSGPYEIYIDGDNAGITRGEVQLTVEPQLKECYTELSAMTVEDYIVLGVSAKVSFEVAEWTLDNLLSIFPNSSAGGNYVGIGYSVGERLSSYAKEMVLHPAELPSEDTERDIQLWKVVPGEKFSVKFGKSTDRTFSVSFNALPDNSKTQGEQIGKIFAL
jgi:hypothetical protein